MKKELAELLATLGLSKRKTAELLGFQREMLSTEIFPGKLKIPIIKMATEYAKTNPDKAMDILKGKGEN